VKAPAAASSALLPPPLPSPWPPSLVWLFPLAIVVVTFGDDLFSNRNWLVHVLKNPPVFDNDIYSRQSFNGWQYRCTVFAVAGVVLSLLRSKASRSAEIAIYAVCAIWGFSFATAMDSTFRNSFVPSTFSYGVTYGGQSVVAPLGVLVVACCAAMALWRWRRLSSVAKIVYVAGCLPPLALWASIAFEWVH